MKNKYNEKFLDRLSESPPLILTLGFFILISIGALILSTPFVTRSGNPTNPIDAIFIAASASCVTGLSPVNTAEHWNSLGQVVLIILIQIGGLGIMTLASIIPLILRKKIGIKTRLILKEQLNIESMEGVIRLFRYVLGFTLAVESLGALFLAIRFVPTYGLGKGIWFSVFHSISAFCNAGFDILGDSIYPLRGDYLVNITIMSLVIIGGLGFMVTSEIYYKRHFKSISTHSKLVLLTNAGLILVGALGFFILESLKGGVLNNETIGDGVLISFFQSVSARTAGFYSADLSKINDSTAILLISLMFIGGSPGSTAGGIKTTTFVVLILAVISVIKNEKEPIVFKIRISDDTIKKALSIFVISLSIVIFVSFVIAAIEDFAFIDILYETASALGTVGATLGITDKLSAASKILITLCMYLGRIGPMTMALSFGLKSDVRMIRYPEGFISIG
ncbi:TrkH family potassium uptake protein [Anaerococcus sp. Marseille-Q7828]|uniref:TrkH family potassium uptake protein n=1 Tax=Anaerococcus sp. Marseille-Q7828 TaxID=3036300 RepID=UPI0024AD254C|nr:TrkH family potassium uptake protein [Anaerococcus sp. Marseille-Q7828]